MNLPDQLQQLGWIDLSLLGVLALSVVVGLWRGLVFELVSVTGWVVAWVIANGFGATVAPLLPFGGAPDSRLRYGLAYLILFFGVLLACAVLARLLRALVSASPLSAFDRLLGGAFGAVRAVLLGLALATAVALSPLSHSPSWQASQGALLLGQALQGLKPVLPEALSRRLEA